MINKKVSTVAGSLIIVAIVIAIGFVFLSSKEKEVQDQNNEAREITSSINPQDNTNQSAQAQPIIESRLVGSGCYKMKEGQIDKYNFREDFNLDSADMMIGYENKQFGISFDVPYNKKWGNKDCVVLPYVHRQKIDSNTKYLKIDFGIFKAWIGDAYHFNISKKRSTDDIINEQRGSSPDLNPRAKTIGKHQVVIYESYGMGTQRIYEILGDENNYVFTQSWIKDIKSDLESDELEKIIKTLEIK
ncbi:MAG: hypothetical protein RBS77_04715 [Candidatus Moranbacteria bacterium]|jgi:hypothetical protein|nr:hypothetical protein [Candidatus Moranbacteria bacterium]